MKKSFSIDISKIFQFLVHLKRFKQKIKIIVFYSFLAIRFFLCERVIVLFEKFFIFRISISEHKPQIFLRKARIITSFSSSFLLLLQKIIKFTEENLCFTSKLYSIWRSQKKINIWTFYWDWWSNKENLNCEVFLAWLEFFNKLTNES